eukprot:16712-Heterocapsa_arctica.AAC.1
MMRHAAGVSADVASWMGDSSKYISNLRILRTGSSLAEVKSVASLRFAGTMVGVVSAAASTGIV